MEEEKSQPNEPATSTDQSREEKMVERDDVSGFRSRKKTCLKNSIDHNHEQNIFIDI